MHFQYLPWVPLPLSQNTGYPHGLNALKTLLWQLLIYYTFLAFPGLFRAKYAVVGPFLSLYIFFNYPHRCPRIGPDRQQWGLYLAASSCVNWFPVSPLASSAVMLLSVQNHYARVCPVTPGKLVESVCNAAAGRTELPG